LNGAQDFNYLLITVRLWYDASRLNSQIKTRYSSHAEGAVKSKWYAIVFLFALIWQKHFVVEKLISLNSLKDPQSLFNECMVLTGNGPI
jgi:hypothetical protein